MIENIKSVKNPLTIIAIFAGIAEVSGTVVMPFMSEANQGIFIYFLMAFPTLLVLLFFITLYIKANVLYAPSDFTDEKNYLVVNEYYDKSNKVQIMEKREPDIIKKDRNNKVFFTFSDRLNKELEVNSNLDYPIFIANVAKAATIKKDFEKKGYKNVTIYTRFKDEIFADNESEAIWVGVNIDFETIKKVINDAVSIYPNLKYVSISKENKDNAAKEIFIGGSTNTAIERNAKKLSTEDFKAIRNARNMQELESIITNLFY